MGGELSFNLCLPLASAIYFKVNGRNLYSLPLFSPQPTIIWLLSIPQPQTAFCSHQITPTWQTEWVFSQPHLTGPPRIIWRWKLSFPETLPGFSDILWVPVPPLWPLSQEQSLILLLLALLFNPKLVTLYTCLDKFIYSHAFNYLLQTYTLAPKSLTPSCQVSWALHFYQMSHRHLSFKKSKTNLILFHTEISSLHLLLDPLYLLPYQMVPSNLGDAIHQAGNLAVIQYSFFLYYPYLVNHWDFFLNPL